ncbi:hypothetical protein BT96DRAFT_912922 [Gymnopus androsaceus JB14]|uniref:Uncharacterized protein n=1 Tax=Gymnopus androsaceus JB14 TaxID=1447944 RepID=A0A6A4IJE1_9AGAR|nr:hypothetical protein BT96DRAFT_912922 [Gymnopus androsaceus JB14]
MTTKSTAKFTYTERVVCGVNDLEKTHHKQSFHISLIKSQVKKNADKKKDKLGPNWTTFVIKVIHKLVEEGIFKKSSRSGYFQMSPATRKCFKDAQKVLSTLGPSSTDLEAALVKSVARGNIGKKRARDDDEIDSTPTKRMKTARSSLSTTSGGSSSPWMRKPKRELVAEIERREEEARGRQALMDRSPSPLSVPDEVPEDLIEGPLTPLSAQYDQDDDDDDSVDIAGQQSMDDFDMSGPQTRPSTPEPYAPSTPAQPIATAPQPLRPTNGLLQHVRPRLGGVSRTASGSFLSHISNRFTPSPGSDYDGSNQDSSPMAAEAAASLFSPLATRTAQGPVPHEKMVALSNELARFEEENRRLKVDGTAHKLHIETRAAELETGTLTLRNALTQSTLQSSTLQAQLSAGDAETALLRKTLVNKDQEIASLVGQLNDVDETRTQDLAIAQQVTSKLQEEITALKEQLDAREAEFTAKLSASEESLKASSVALQEKTTELNQLQDNLQRAQESVEALQTTLEMTNASHLAEIDQHNSAITSRTVAELRSEVDASTALCAQLQAELEQTVTDRTRFSDELDAERVHSATLKGKLDATLTHIHEIEDELEEMHGLKAIDATTIQDLRDTIFNFEAAQRQQLAMLTLKGTQASTPAGPSKRATRYSI